MAAPRLSFLLLLYLSGLIPHVAGFKSPPPRVAVEPDGAFTSILDRSLLRQHQTTSSVRQSASDDSDSQRDDTLPPLSSDGSKFNPFAARDAAQSASFGGVGGIDSVGTNRPVSSFSSSNLISVRKMQMQQVLSDLLTVSDGDAAELQSVLEQHAEVLLAPFLPNADFVDDDPDTIYTPDMTPLQRLEVYQDALQNRIQSARNPSVRTVLQAMKEFVADNVQQ